MSGLIMQKGEYLSDTGSKEIEWIQKADFISG